MATAPYNFKSAVTARSATAPSTVEAAFSLPVLDDEERRAVSDDEERIQSHLEGDGDAAGDLAIRHGERTYVKTAEIDAQDRAIRQTSSHAHHERDRERQPISGPTLLPSAS